MTRMHSLYLLIHHPPISNPKHTPSPNIFIFLLFSIFISIFSSSSSTHLFSTEMCSATATTPLFSTDHHLPKFFTRLCKPFHSRVPTSLTFHSSPPTFFVRATVSFLSNSILLNTFQVFVFLTGFLLIHALLFIFVIGSMLVYALG